MAKASPIQQNFNGGELSPLMEGRTDLAKYHTGCAKLQNFIPTVQGAAVRRAGTRFISAVKNSATRTWFAKFQFSQAEAFILEFGNLSLRFYTDRGQLLSGTAYEITTPYTTADLENEDGAFGLQMAQSGDVIYLAHPDHQQRKLSRIANTNWTLTVFAPTDGPFLPLNQNQNIFTWASAVTGDITLKSTRDIFTPDHVGALFYIEAQNLADVPPWEPNKKIASSGVSPFGELRRNDGNVYRCVSTGSTATNEWRTGNIGPVHTSGIAADGDGNAITSGTTVFAEKAGVDWEYVHSGFGIASITAYTSATQVSASVIRKLPESVASTATLTSVGSFVGNGSTTVFSVAGATSDDSEDYIVTEEIIIKKFGEIIYEDFRTLTPDEYSVTGTTTDQITFDEAPSSGYDVTVQEFSSPNKTTKWAFGAWSDANEWPRAVAFFRERLVFAGKNTIWLSVPGDFDSFFEGLPTEVLADNAITRTILTEQANRIQWLAAADALIVGTIGGEVAVSEITTAEPLAPANIKHTDQSGYGSRAIKPLKVGNSLIFAQKAGRKLREYVFDIERNGYRGRDLTVLSEHITKGGIIQMAYQAEPQAIIWCVLDNGKLIGLTYEVEQDVYAWHEHEVGSGFVESVGVIPSTDGSRDDVYLIVKRTINGATARYVEWIEEEWTSDDDQEDAFYLDCGATYDGTPATVISGLSHLEGETVQVLADGMVVSDKTVSSGQITLETAASVVHVGYGYTSTMKTMRIEAGASDGTAQGKTQRIHRITTRFLDTWQGKIGPTESGLEAFNFRDTTDAMDAPVPSFTGDKTIPFPGGYQSQGARVVVVQDLPLPMTVLAVMPQLHTQDR